MHVMNKHVIVCLVNDSSFGGEVFLRVSRQVRYLENSLLDRALLSQLYHGSGDQPVKSLIWYQHLLTIYNRRNPLHVRWYVYAYADNPRPNSDRACSRIARIKRGPAAGSRPTRS